MTSSVKSKQDIILKEEGEKSSFAKQLMLVFGSSRPLGLVFGRHPLGKLSKKWLDLVLNMGYLSFQSIFYPLGLQNLKN